MLYLFIIMILALSMMAVALFSNDLIKKHFSKGKLKGIGFAACIIVVLLSLPMCCTVVDSGEVGIRFHKWSSNEQDYGGVEGTCKGWVFYNPITTSVFTYPTFTQRK